jgi:hypothetical protein
MDIGSIRRKNLADLIADRYHGRQSEFADAVKRQPDYISRQISGTKGFGEKLARSYEQILHLQAGFFDRAPAESCREAPPPRYVDIAADDYPALLAQRVRGWDEAQQLALLNFVETMNAAHLERPSRLRKAPAPHKPK